MRPIKDMLGQKFNRLLVIKFCEKPPKVTQKKAYWVCRCDCGTISIVSGNALRSGRVRSCGCLLRDKNRSRALSGVGMERSSFNAHYYHYVSQARTRGLEFSLTKKQFYKISSANCYYCGKPPSQICKPPTRGAGGNFIYNGIDRVDSTIGYISGNCVPCCKICNTAKSDLTLADFLDWVKQVYKHSLLSSTTN